MPKIHLNAAGASIRSDATTAIMVDFLKDEVDLGAYELVSHYRREDLERPYQELATLLGCSAAEISIVTSATEAWNQIIHGLAWTWKAGDGIVTAITEYGSNYLTYLQLKRRFGIQIHVVDETPAGDIDLEALERLIQEEKVVLISLPHVPTSSGRVYDVAKIGEIAEKYNVLFLLDACQSVGQMDVKVETIKCHMLTGTGRKYLRAPRGCGFLYCADKCRAVFEPSTIDVHSAVLTSEDSYNVSTGSNRFEKYEMSYAAKVGLGVAVAQLNKAGIAKVESKISELAGYLREGLGKIDGVLVEDRGATLCGIVSFSVIARGERTAKELTEVLYQELTAAGYSISLSRRTSTLIDMTRRGVECVIRASPHIYNTADELDAFVESVTRSSEELNTSCHHCKRNLD